jgi:hypothetical protein
MQLDEFDGLWDIPKTVNKKIKKVGERYAKTSSIGKAVSSAI